MFTELRKNSDAQAVTLAKQLMDNAELLPEVRTANLTPYKQREFASKLANGEQSERIRADQTTSVKKEQPGAAAT